MLYRHAPLDAVTHNGGVPLIWACMEGDVDIIKFLLEQGADISAVTKGRGTALHHAASYGHVGAVR
jgi:ankyrin repeat protein